MIITETILNQILEKPRNSYLDKAEEYESRLMLHGHETDCEPTFDAFKNFLTKYPDALLPPEKAQTFKSLITYPLPTVGLIKDVYSELWKVFDAQNKVEDFVFTKSDLEEDFQRYREQIKEPDYWASKAWELIQTKVNSILIVDLPAEQTTDQPEPSFFTVPIEQVRDMELKRDQETLEYLIWSVDVTAEEKKKGITDKVYVYDDASYQIAVRMGNGAKYTITLTNPHDLGYCPARHIWTDTRAPMQKAAPHGSELGNLDWILYQTISGRNLELYAGFPIITTYQEECTYMNEDGIHCDGGFLNVPVLNGDGTASKYNREVCPECASRSLVGPGSVKEVPAPIDNQSADLMPAAEVTKGDTDSLKWFDESLQSRITSFKKKVIGEGQEPNNNQAKNEKQITSGFEARQTILSNVARNLEKIQKFALDTVAKLRYGAYYQYSVISYGNKFFLQTDQQTLLDYNQAKTDGLPNYLLEEMRMSLLQKRFRNNPDMMNRIMLLDYLEPLPDYSVVNLIPVTSIDPKVIFKKINFNDLIKRFELENGNIAEYRNGIDLKVRIALIDKILNQYVDEAYVAPPPPLPANTPPEKVTN